MARPAPSYSPAAPPILESATKCSSKVRVLLVSSDPSEFRLIRGLLDDIAPHSFTLEQIKVYEAALDTIGQHAHDVFLVASNLNDRSGTEFLIEAQMRGANAPFIMLSSERDLDSDLEAMEAGAADYLVREQLNALLLERSIRYALERKRSRDDLKRLLEFERLISAVSTSFINLAPEQIDTGINLALKAIGHFAQVDRGCIFEYSQARTSLRMSYEWCAPGIEPVSHLYQQLPARIVAPILDRLARDEPWYFHNIDELPLPLMDFKALLENRGVRSMINVPMISGGQLRGFLSFATLFAQKSFGPELTSTAKIAGQIFTGVIDRREALAEVTEQKTFLRQVIDANPNIIFARNRAGQYTLVNKATADILGIPVEQILGRTVSEVLGDPELEKIAKREDEEVFRTGQPVYDPEFVTIHKKSGKRKWYQSIKTLLYVGDNKPDQILGVFSDITERKRAEDSLRAIVKGTASSTADNFFRSLVQHLASALGIRYAFVARTSDAKHGLMQTLAFWDGIGFGETFEYCYLGGPCEHVVGKALACFPSDLQKVFPNVPKLAQLGAQNYLGVPMFDSQGATLGLLAVMHDQPVIDWSTATTMLTIFAARAGAEIERIDAEQETIRLQRQLTQAQKMDAIGQLAAGIAHDLNNALGAVIGHLELMKINDISGAELQSSVAIALSGCERATSLIDQLLGFTRQGKFNFSTVGLRRICGETIDFLGKIIGPDFKIEFSGDNLFCAEATELSAKELLVRGDPAQIQQAITNLMINAKQSMPSGGTLTFSFSTTFVKAAQHFNPHAQPGIYAILSVSDSGTGIDPTIIDKIFEPFFTTKSESNGSGLGLAMVYGIMQRHGGWIEVQSESGKGSTFKLSFPQISGSEVQQLVNPIENSNTNSGNILVIDDEPFLVDLAKKFLEMSGFRVSGFCNALEAVDWFSAHYSEIDLVIMDMKMPAMDGTSCFEKLRTIDSSVRVVVLSGYLQDDSVHSLLQEGAVKFFQKPLKYPDLVRWISEYLGNKAQIAQH